VFTNQVPDHAATIRQIQSTDIVPLMKYFISTSNACGEAFSIFSSSSLSHLRVFIVSSLSFSFPEIVRLCTVKMAVCPLSGDLSGY
jgi:hypothetical protein